MALSQFDPAYDFNNDQQLTLADRDAYLASHGSMLGDANFDGVIDSQDLDIVMRNMNRQGTGWAQGDFNASGSTTGYDLYLWISARSAVAGQAITGDLNYDNVIDIHDIDLLYLSFRTSDNQFPRIYRRKASEGRIGFMERATPSFVRC